MLRRGQPHRDRHGPLTSRTGPTRTRCRVRWRLFPEWLQRTHRHHRRGQGHRPRRRYAPGHTLRWAGFFRLRANGGRATPEQATTSRVSHDEMPFPLHEAPRRRLRGDTGRVQRPGQPRRARDWCEASASERNASHTLHRPPAVRQRRKQPAGGQGAWAWWGARSGPSTPGPRDAAEGGMPRPDQGRSWDVRSAAQASVMVCTLAAI